MAGRDQAMSQTTRALLLLRESLLNGEFQPGERVSEVPLSRRLGVSRTPLRQALIRLEREGLLEGLPGGGFVVRELTMADINDAIEMRGVLEGTAARLAAERLVSTRELAAMRNCSRQMDTLVRGPERDEASFAGYMSLNGRFHKIMVELAKSEILTKAMENIVTLPFATPNGAFVLAQAQLPESREILVLAQDHHRSILDAIENREGARAESIAREHARISRRNLEIALQHRGVLESFPGASLLRLPNAERAGGEAGD